MDDPLRAMPLFAELSDEDLAVLRSGCEDIVLGAGEVLFDEGHNGDRAYVIVDGEIEILKETAGKEVLLAVRKQGEVIGEMALLQASPRMATARAGTEARLVSLAKPSLDTLLETSPVAARTLFASVMTRWRDTESRLRQSERMAQLGTLTAGVAHELNNPAAAIERAAAHLDEAVDRAREAWAALVGLKLDPQARDEVGRLLDLADGARDEAQLTALARSEREDDIEGWLEDRDVPEPWKDAPQLVALGLTTDDLPSMLDAVELGTTIRAVTTTSEVHSLVSQAERGARRIGEIVKALKSYSYLDRGDLHEVDIAEGLDDTLLILRSKLDGITVHRDIDEELPTVEAHGGELNQVWTNLLDNAADALLDAGIPDPVITVRSSVDAEWVDIEIEDNGPGIPADIQPRVFDSFFTTKAPGHGTGLGLDISYNIVVRHGGEITVDSEPGRTVFHVVIPIDAATKENS